MRLIRFEHDNSILEGILTPSGDTATVISAGRKVEYQLDDVTLLPPSAPSKIVCVGLNYRDHAEELNMEIPREPVIFIKPATAVIGPGGTIIYEGEGEVHYEGELAFVIGRGSRHVRAGAAYDHISGFSCFNDVTARGLQKKDVQWTRAKSFDTFAPFGPWIETELDPSDLGIRTYLNGNVVQSSRTSRMIFSVPEILEFISGIMTLMPGDVIATGTPPGVGPMGSGDKVKVEIDGIGELVNIRG
ncbi:MAG: fumarylacetoacetate hydrolase family protein [Candidatus Omnitrophica bacterium]|nr:fumarylacetoacetate hydrolase family protein [Candidatus Omnitrophota bacterium]MDD5487959.1 fumarylacetoacetate hydrolase family protein [Candidatus Omnitrophota bacterium]